MRKAFLTAVVLGALASPLAADRIDDDLAAVKKAVGTTVTAEARPAADEAAPRPAEKAAPERRAEKASPERASRDRVRARKNEPRWFRVRIAEKGEKHGRVSVNLPLDIVRALGEDLKIEDCHDGHHPGGRTLGDVLRALDSGESLVDIDDDDATVHVWVE